MRTLSEIGGSHACGLALAPLIAAPCRLRCACRHAAIASFAVPKTAYAPSPVVLTTCPPDDSMAERKTPSCHASSERIASGACSHNVVLPSTSEKRKVTVPVGSIEGMHGI